MIVIPEWFYRGSRCLFISVFLITSFGFIPVQAGEVVVPALPKPGTMVALTPQYIPAHLQGMSIDPKNPFKFDFYIHKGEGQLSQQQKTVEYSKLVKYFLAALTVPEHDQWVNLSPYENNRIIENNFGKTEMGRDLLTQDYLLKQITSSLMYPESSLGKTFWSKVYAKAQKEMGSTKIPVNTFNKVWIVPDEAVVYESGGAAYILKSHLKVMLEEDYLASSKQSSPNALVGDPNKVTSQIIRQIILPELEREVNEGKNFALLRQIYSGMVLATWYKRSLKESILAKVYANKAKVKGVEGSQFSPDVIYQQYLAAFKKGVYSYIKEEIDPATQQMIPRKYFAGGFHQALDGVMKIVNHNTITQFDFDSAMSSFNNSEKNKLDKTVFELNQLNPNSNINPTEDVDKTRFLNYLLTQIKDVTNKENISKGVLSESPTEGVRFNFQVDIQQRLGAMYNAPVELIQAVQDTLDVNGDINALVEDKFNELTKGFPEEEKMKIKRQQNVLQNKYAHGTKEQRHVNALFTLLTPWAMRLREQYGNYHRVYLARDAGYLSMMDNVLNQISEPIINDGGSSVYALSRSRMSGNGVNYSIYENMKGLIEQSVLESGDDYDEFLRILREKFKVHYEKDVNFRKSVDFARQEMNQLGYNAHEGIVFVDTGFYGTIPLFLKNVLEMNDNAPNIVIALIEPSSIEQFREKLFGLKTDAFTTTELVAISGASHKINPMHAGNEMEQLEGHPISFDEQSMTIARSSLKEQLSFFVIQVLAIKAVLVFLKKLAEAGGDFEKVKTLMETMRYSLFDYINTYPSKNINNEYMPLIKAEKFDLNAILKAKSNYDQFDFITNPKHKVFQNINLLKPSLELLSPQKDLLSIISKEKFNIELVENMQLKIQESILNLHKKETWFEKMWVAVKGMIQKTKKPDPAQNNDSDKAMIARRDALGGLFSGILVGGLLQDFYSRRPLVVLSPGQHLPTEFAVFLDEQIQRGEHIDLSVRRKLLEYKNVVMDVYRTYQQDIKDLKRIIEINSNQKVLVGIEGYSFDDESKFVQQQRLKAEQVRLAISNILRKLGLWDDQYAQALFVSRIGPELYAKLYMKQMSGLMELIGPEDQELVSESLRISNMIYKKVDDLDIHVQNAEEEAFNSFLQQRVSVNAQRTFPDGEARQSILMRFSNPKAKEILSEIMDLDIRLASLTRLRDAHISVKLAEMTKDQIVYFRVGSLHGVDIADHLKSFGVVVKRISDAAMNNSAAELNPGGIDFDSKNLNLQIKRDSNGLPLPIIQQDLSQFKNIEGFALRILDIQPVVTLPILNELKQKIQ